MDKSDSKQGNIVVSNDLVEETKKIWNDNAAFWDQFMGEGGSFQKHLIGPNTEKLLGLKSGDTVLDIGCGNGAFARKMAALGAQVVAIDFSETFIALAKERTTENNQQIKYMVLDATQQSDLIALGTRKFDAAVCTMALMDMPDIQPLLNALAHLLKKDGRFVFSVMHPCFNSGKGLQKIVEEIDKDGEIVVTHSVKISQYLTGESLKGIGVIGQPVPQYYFHRPISALLKACFDAGFVLDALEEPAFAENTDAQRPFSWSNYHDIPPVLIARLRLADA